MSQRLLDTTKWLWCILVIYSGPTWKPVRGITVRTPPKNPSTIEAQAKFFQDFFSVQLSPYKIEFGHVCEDPNGWEQRYEKKDYKNHRDMGKVRWGDKKGGYGEHYWDLNHAGHAGNHGDDGYDDSDDGSYRENEGNDSYDSPPESHNYEVNQYDPEKASYEESGRAKRAHSRPKAQRKAEDSKGEQSHKKETGKGKRSEQHRIEETRSVEKYDDENDDYEDQEKEEKEVRKQPLKQNSPQRYLLDKFTTEQNKQPKERNQIVLVVGHKEKDTQEPQQFVSKPLESKHFVPYEGGAGIRQHQQLEASAANTAPRLFLEPYTGHVVDRTTGQAYVLQPIVQNVKLN